MVDTTEEQTTESIVDALTTSMNELDTEESTDSISEEAVKEDAEAETAEATDDDEDGEEQETVFQAPEHWSADERTKFDSLPPETKEFVLERDAHFQTGYQEKAQSIAAITEALEPWKDALAQRGVTAEQAIRTLFAHQSQIDANPLQGILNVIQSYGVQDQMREHFAPQTDEEDFTDPGVKALKLENQALESRFNQFERGQQQQQADRGRQQISTFKSAVDDKGQLKHPHFEQVKTLMGAYVQGGETLDKAYEKAVWTIPEYRQAQQRSVVEKTDREKADKVKKAKRAARGVTTNGKDDPDAGKDALSLHDDLTEAFRQHSS